MAVSAAGASGHTCFFEQYPWDAPLPDDAVIMLTLRSGHEFQPKYIGYRSHGRPQEGGEGFAAQKAQARRLGADCLLVHQPRVRFWGMERHMQALVEDLVAAYRPPCNTGEVPAGRLNLQA